MAAETFRIEIPIDVEDNTDPGVSSAKRKVKSFDDVNRQTQERLDKMNRTKYRVVLDALDRTGTPAAVPAKEPPLTAASRQDFFQTMDAKTFREQGAGAAKPAAPAAPVQPSRPRFSGSELGGRVVLRDSARPIWPAEPVPAPQPPEKPSRQVPISPSPFPLREEPEEPPVPEAPPERVPELTREQEPAGEAAQPLDTTSQAAPAEPEQTALEPEKPAPWRFAGEVLRTYIIAEDGEDVYLIDKHAAHERMNFDRMKASQEPVMRQQLLASVAVDLAQEQYAALLEHLPLLEEFGFEAEDFGSGCLMVRAIPSDLETGQIRETLEELAEKLLTCGQADPAAARDAMLHTMACKASIKGGWETDPAELRVLMDKVQSGEIQYCPHGRPVKVKLTRYEIEKMFKRA